MEICQFCKKVCSGDRGLSLHMYHNNECFQNLTNMTKQFHKYALCHSQMHNSSCNQEYVHQDNKVKVNSDSKQNVGIFFIQHNDFNDCHSSVLAENQLSPIFESILMNQQTKFSNRIKNTIKMKHNLAEIDLLKILHDLKCPISAYDIIVGWATR